MNRDPATPTIGDVSTAALLAEVARRFRLRFGRLEVTFHDGEPAPRVVVEHRLHKDLNDRPPAPTGGTQ